MATGTGSVTIKVTIDRHINFYSEKTLSRDATVLDLKEALARQFAHGPPHWQLTNARREDFALSPQEGFVAGRTPPLSDSTPLRNVPPELVVVHPHEIGAELVEQSDAVEYRVLQGTIVKKPSTDPSAQGVVRIARRVGSTVFTTGRTWRGPRGGEWVELDSVVERVGWLLVEGPGFGVPGPILQRILPGEAPPMVLHIEKPAGDGCVSIHTFVLRVDSTVRDAKEWIALICGLEPNHIIVGPKGCALTPTGGAQQCELLVSEDSMAGAGYADGDQVRYCYIGDLARGYEGKEPTWEGRLGVAGRARPQPLRGRRARADACPSAQKQAPHHLRKHFQALDLEEAAQPDEVKRHYRRLALACHPDKHPGDREGATVRFQEMKAAYEAIMDALGH